MITSLFLLFSIHAESDPVAPADMVLRRCAKELDFKIASMPASFADSFVYCRSDLSPRKTVITVAKAFGYEARFDESKIAFENKNNPRQWPKAKCGSIFAAALKSRHYGPLENLIASEFVQKTGSVLVDFGNLFPVNWKIQDQESLRKELQRKIGSNGPLVEGPLNAIGATGIDDEGGHLVGLIMTGDTPVYRFQIDAPFGWVDIGTEYLGAIDQPQWSLWGQWTRSQPPTSYFSPATVIARRGFQPKEVAEEGVRNPWSVPDLRKFRFGADVECAVLPDLFFNDLFKFDHESKEVGIGPTCNFEIRSDGVSKALIPVSEHRSGYLVLKREKGRLNVPLLCSWLDDYSTNLGFSSIESGAIARVAQETDWRCPFGVESWILAKMVGSVFGRDFTKRSIPLQSLTPAQRGRLVASLLVNGADYDPLLSRVIIGTNLMGTISITTGSQDVYFVQKTFQNDSYHTSTRIPSSIETWALTIAQAVAQTPGLKVEQVIEGSRFVRGNRSALRVDLVDGKSQASWFLPLTTVNPPSEGEFAATSGLDAGTSEKLKTLAKYRLEFLAKATRNP